LASWTCYADFSIAELVTEQVSGIFSTLTHEAGHAYAAKKVGTIEKSEIIIGLSGMANINRTNEDEKLTTTTECIELKKWSITDKIPVFGDKLSFNSAGNLGGYAKYSFSNQPSESEEAKIAAAGPIFGAIADFVLAAVAEAILPNPKPQQKKLKKKKKHTYHNHRDKIEKELDELDDNEEDDDDDDNEIELQMRRAEVEKLEKKNQSSRLKSYIKRVLDRAAPAMIVQFTNLVLPLPGTDGFKIINAYFPSQENSILTAVVAIITGALGMASINFLNKFISNASYARYTKYRIKPAGLLVLGTEIGKCAGYLATKKEDLHPKKSLEVFLHNQTSLLPVISAIL